jgi:hypothetical protein
MTVGQPVFGFHKTIIVICTQKIQSQNVWMYIYTLHGYPHNCKLKSLINLEWMNEWVKLGCQNNQNHCCEKN